MSVVSQHLSRMTEDFGEFIRAGAPVLTVAQLRDLVHHLSEIDHIKNGQPAKSEEALLKQTRNKYMNVAGAASIVLAAASGPLSISAAAVLSTAGVLALSSSMAANVRVALRRPQKKNEAKPKPLHYHLYRARRLMTVAMGLPADDPRLATPVIEALASTSSAMAKDIAEVRFNFSQEVLRNEIVGLMSRQGSWRVVERAAIEASVMSQAALSAAGRGKPDEVLEQMGDMARQEFVRTLRQIGIEEAVINDALCDDESITQMATMLTQLRGYNYTMDECEQAVPLRL